MTSARGIDFDIRPSRQLTCWLVMLVALAAASPLFTALPLPVRWLSTAAIVVDGVRRIHRYRHPAWRRLSWAADGAWTVTGRHGAATEAELRAARRVGQGVCLSLRWRRRWLHLLFLPDNTPAADLRMLRARLKRVRAAPADGLP
ncbi:hypothetical protein [Luteibacter sp. ME-Dv--P-043b]|jgi:hypothetical protein|uniref:hypothetical protein n=1 Tax=unclassified Luteibacter TaxID=2620188 RepID=UPI002552923E|nr:hypothetical protein [Luteibacter sp. ME-Dv--P-043b]